MGGKAKFQKHSAKELNAKANAHKNKGGGKAGMDKRSNAKLKLSYVCDICRTASPDIKSYELHFTNKHPKAVFNKEQVEQRALALAETQK